jgi:hypothetical protein
VEQVHPHRFRHTFAHLWLTHEGAERDLMRITGRRDPSMLGASAAAERARAAHGRLSPEPGDTKGAALAAPLVTDACSATGWRLSRRRNKGASHRSRH